MSVFHVHARLLEGPPDRTVRDETRTSETDDWDEANALARELVALGFTVWIYDHGHETPFLTASDFRVVARFRPLETGPVAAPAPTPRARLRRT